MLSIISGSTRGSSPWILTIISYLFPSFWCSSLQRSVPTKFRIAKISHISFPWVAADRRTYLTISKWFWCHYQISAKFSAIFCNFFVIHRHNYIMKRIQSETTKIKALQSVYISRFIHNHIWSEWSRFLPTWSNSDAIFALSHVLCN